MKKETEETPPAEEITEEVTPPPETVTPSLEELQAQRDAARAEAERYENLYKDSQRKESKLAERERRLDVLDTIPSLQQQIEDIREYNETMAAFLEQRLAQGDYTEQPAIPRSPFDELRRRQEERRKQPAPKTETKEPASQVDPEDLRASLLAQGIIEDMGWNMETPAVKKTLHLDDPKKALEILKKEQKAQRDREVEETIQARIKKEGWTTPETGQPSGASLDDDAFMIKYSEGKSDDHERAKKILQMK